MSFEDKFYYAVAVECISVH